MWVIPFRREGGACLSSTVRKKSQCWFAFSTDENSEILESSAWTVNVSNVPNSPVSGRRRRDGNVEAGFSAIMVDSSESVAVDFNGRRRQVEQQHCQ